MIRISDFAIFLDHPDFVLFLDFKRREYAESNCSSCMRHISRYLIMSVGQHVSFFIYTYIYKRLILLKDVMKVAIR